MLSQFVWWGGITLEILLCVRAFRGKLASRYPIFYTYIAFILIQDVLRFVVYQWDQGFYKDLYWITEFLAVALGCGVVFEIYRVGLSAYPGTARMARNVLGLVFACALAKALAQAASDPRWWLEAATTDIEAAVRTVEAIAIFGLVGLFLFYSVPFGRNLKGILLGYGLFVFTSVACLAFVSSADEQRLSFLAKLYPISYLLALCVWLTRLWSYQPSPVAHQTVLIEQDYQRLAAATHRRLQEARGYLTKAARS